MPEEKVPDVLPEAANQVLAALWILLFGGRWIGVTFLLATGLLTAEQRNDLDRQVLLPCYLILLMITLIVLTLRLVRRRKFGAPASPSGQS